MEAKAEKERRGRKRNSRRQREAYRKRRTGALKEKKATSVLQHPTADDFILVARLPRWFPGGGKLYCLENSSCHALGSGG